MLVAFKVKGQDAIKNRIEAFVDKNNPIMELQTVHKDLGEWFINVHVDFTEEGLDLLKGMLVIVSEEDGTIE